MPRLTLLAIVALSCAGPVATNQLSAWRSTDAALLSRLGLPSAASAYSCVDSDSLKARMRWPSGFACALQKPLEDGSMARVRRADDGRILEAHRIWVMDVVAAEGQRAVVLAEFTKRLGEATRCEVGQVPGQYYWMGQEGFVMLRTQLATVRRGDRETIMAEARPIDSPLSGC